jgi:hypothetical protein
LITLTSKQLERYMPHIYSQDNELSFDDIKNEVLNADKKAKDHFKKGPGCSNIAYRPENRSPKAQKRQKDRLLESTPEGLTSLRLGDRSLRVISRDFFERSEKLAQHPEAGGNCGNMLDVVAYVFGKKLPDFIKSIIDLEKLPPGYAVINDRWAGIKACDARDYPDRLLDRSFDRGKKGKYILYNKVRPINENGKEEYETLWCKPIDFVGDLLRSQQMKLCVGINFADK